MSLYISPSIYFPGQIIPIGDKRNVFIEVNAAQRISELDYFSPKDAVLQAAGFLQDPKSSNNGKDLKLGGAAPSNLSSISESESFGSPSAQVVSVDQNSSMSKLFSNQVNTISEEPAHEEKSAGPTTSNNAPLFSGFDAFTPTASNPPAFSAFDAFTPTSGPNTGFPASAPVQQNFDDVFSAFDKSHSLKTQMIKSEVSVIFQEELLALSRGANLEKVEYFGTFTATLSNASFSEGKVSFLVKDTQSQIANYIANNSVVKKCESSTSDTLSRVLVAALPCAKKPVAILKCPFINTFRPVLFQVRNNVSRNSNNQATVAIRISLNPQFKTTIELFTIAVSLSAIVGSSTIKNLTTNPPGGALNNQVLTWQCARLLPQKQPQLQMEAVVNFNEDHPPSATTVPVILKGVYSANTFSNIDIDATSVIFNDEESCSGFDLVFNKIRRTKFEYRFS